MKAPFYPRIPASHVSKDFFEMWDGPLNVNVLVFEAQVKEWIATMDLTFVFNELQHQHGYNLEGAMALVARLRNEMKKDEEFGTTKKGWK